MRKEFEYSTSSVLKESWEPGQQSGTMLVTVRRSETSPMKWLQTHLLLSCEPPALDTHSVPLPLHPRQMMSQALPGRVRGPAGGGSQEAALQ